MLLELTEFDKHLGSKLRKRLFSGTGVEKRDGLHLKVSNQPSTDIEHVYFLPHLHIGAPYSTSLVVSRVVVNKLRAEGREVRLFSGAG